MKKLFPLIFLTIPVLFLSCNSEYEDSFDKTIICSKLTDALIANDEDDVSVGINNLLNAQGQFNGQEKSFEKLIEQVDSCPNLQVTDSCFGCIETNPPQSEIRVTVIQNNQTVSRAIDLQNFENKLIFLKIHD
ncbi:hypothetical protein I2I11_18765 [Pontibacter sp. 172403-2]|uniref:hypothetical protein n=1 Tax=Pontibacter rufus TaxID=2791028 RepID=UPI0018B0103F|nr:hypothetical protein [Pontibacter sp. 172403-2]MBF9255347.1 hypothetical protein [Pontibacter sp. 172403-2]